MFQRTPSSVGVRDQRPTDPEWAASLQPGWQRERMNNFLEIVFGERVDVDLTRDGWTSTASLQRQMVPGAVDETLMPDERDRSASSSTHKR